MKSNQEPKYSLYFSKQSEQDIAGILQYGLEELGRNQAEKYQDRLIETFETLLSNPRIGRIKERYFAGCHMFHVERHEIFYRIDAQAIHIVRILRDDMDFDQWF